MDKIEYLLVEQFKEALFHNFCNHVYHFDETEQEQNQELIKANLLELKGLFEDYLKTIKKMAFPEEKQKQLIHDCLGEPNEQVWQTFRNLMHYRQNVKLQEQAEQDAVNIEKMKKHNEQQKFEFEELERKEKMLNDAIMGMVEETERENQELEKKQIEETKHKELIKHNKKMVRETIEVWNKLVRKEFKNNVA